MPDVTSAAGDCFNRIAKAQGFFNYLTVYNHDTNATPTLKLLIQAKKAGVRRVMYAASSAAYGDAPIQPKIETMQTAPMSP